MIKIEIPDILPEAIEVWKKEASDITKEILLATSLADKHQLIDKYKNHWRKPELVNWLSDLSFEKCWYTETKFGGDYQEVEHFRPKKGTKLADGTSHPTNKGYYWLAFDLSNYRLCKSRPNRKKGTFFPIINERVRAENENEPWQDETPLFLDPLKSNDTLLLSFNDKGFPVPEEGIAPDDLRRVLFTIEKYFLDERVLNKRRESTWVTARALFNKFLNAIKEANETHSIAKRQEAESVANQLRDLVKPSAEFSSVAKASLLKTGDRVAMRIACS
jgi:hypothetical protein